MYSEYNKQLPSYILWVFLFYEPLVRFCGVLMLHSHFASVQLSTNSLCSCLACVCVSKRAWLQRYLSNAPCTRTYGKNSIGFIIIGLYSSLYHLLNMFSKLSMCTNWLKKKACFAGRGLALTVNGVTVKALIEISYKHSVIIYSPSCYSKPEWNLSLFGWKKNK